MSWKDVLKAHCNTEKAHCGTEKVDACCDDCAKENMEKKLVGNQKKIDADKDGKITANDFKILRE